MLTENINKVHMKENPFFRVDNNEVELQYFSVVEIKKVLDFQKTNENYTKTPLYSLENLARHVNVDKIYVKDEAKRFNLNAFKVLGGIYAIGKYLAGKLDKDIADLNFEELKSAEVKRKIGDITFISATDGNHGRGVAWAARELGQKSVIYLPKGSSPARLEAIRNEGADAEITDVNYDETIRICDRLAKENGWIMVQDTAWEGYDKIPLWIMQGYASIAQEIVEELEINKMEAPTHVFLQAGVGSFAAGIAAYLVSYYGAEDINVSVVEPDQADCYYRSFAENNGNIQPVTGDMNSIMAGLCCGEPNTRAFRILKQYAKSFYSCSDAIAALGMRVLGNPLPGDEQIISGESGAVTLGLLYYLRQEIGGNRDIALDENSRILVINSEGDTDPEHYLDIVWKGKNSNI